MSKITFNSFSSPEQEHPKSNSDKKNSNDRLNLESKIVKNQSSEPLINNHCYIALVGVKRKNTFIKQIIQIAKRCLRLEHSSYVFTGHTALHVYTHNVNHTTGFLPKFDGIGSIIKFIFSNYLNFLRGKPTLPIKGVWSDHEKNMMKDKLLKSFKIQVSEKIALEFQNYMNNIKVAKVKYSLQPDSGEKINLDVKNCVYYALNVFIDFFYEYVDKIDEDENPYFSTAEQTEIFSILHDIVETTSERNFTGQSALLHNIALWEKRREARIKTESQDV